jgi:hypothetical protein
LIEANIAIPTESALPSSWIRVASLPSGSDKDSNVRRQLLRNDPRIEAVLYGLIETIEHNEYAPARIGHNCFEKFATIFFDGINIDPVRCGPSRRFGKKIS